MATESGLQFTLTIEGLSDDTFAVLAFVGESALSAPFVFDVKLASRHASISALDTVDRKVTLQIWKNGLLEQRVNGVVRQFVKGDRGFGHTHYTLEFVPALSRLSLRQNSRIFQHQTVPEIISLLLDEMGIDDYAFSLSGSPQVREYCVQYRETDLEFLDRIAAEEGIFYLFVQEKDKHTVLFSDDTQTLPHSDLSLPYNPQAGGLSEEAFIQQWQYAVKRRPSSAVLKDYSFKKPAYGFLHETAGSDMAYQRGDYEHYDFPGRYKSDAAGKPFAQYRLEHLRSDAFVAHATSNVAQIDAGLLFELEEQDDTSSKGWIVISMQCEGTQPQALEEYGGEGMTSFNNHFSVIPGHRPWRPAPQPKPCVQGPQIATVTGPAGEEIFCDEHGRVKVQFPWDRYGQNDEASSCWVRVSQGWAGGQYGMTAIPRIGHEVIVSFLEGDPDQPIITGRTHHATNTPPYVLPTNKTKTVIKTQTHKGEGFNELSFEDQHESQLIYVHAQKDYKEDVRNNQNKNVGNDREKYIGNDQRLTVGQDEENNIHRDRKTVIGQDQHFEVGRDEFRLIKRHFRLEVQDQRKDISRANHDVSVDGNYTNKVLGKTVLESSQGVLIHTDNLTLNGSQKVVIQGPGGKIVIDGGGVTIESPNIQLKGPVAVSTGASAQLATLQGAAIEGTPLVDPCHDCGE
ncbi:type VI secretion system tip protein VgrG [Enterovibrio baiacu]|nr:type VI secretion system tip protein VgrG [Enterovibrio baiacu]